MSRRDTTFPLMLTQSFHHLGTFWTNLLNKPETFVPPNETKRNEAIKSLKSIKLLSDLRGPLNDYDIAFDFYDVFNAHNSHGIGFMGS